MQDRNSLLVRGAAVNGPGDSVDAGWMAPLLLVTKSVGEDVQTTFVTCSQCRKV
jgi:hypothetical protein